MSSAKSKLNQGRMSLLEHVLEFRKRLFRSAFAVAGGTILGWFFVGILLEALRYPVENIATQQLRQAQLNYDTITGAFDLRIQIAFTLGVIFSSPLWLYQIWSFFIPALTRKEHKYAFGFFFTAVPLFLIGAVTGWLVIPHVIALLTSFADEPDSAIMSAKTYFDFVLRFVVAVGIAFVLPVFLVLFNFIGLLSAQTIIKGWRVAIISIAFFCAAVTPAADVLSMFLLAIPMVGLYFVAYFISFLHDKRKTRASEGELIEHIS